jgi:zona occludens toxin
MAVSAYTGPPGAGKSYAMVAEVIVPGVASGRRVLTNIEGVRPDAIVAHCIATGTDPDEVGSVVTFHGDDALKPGFFPTEATGDADTFVKGGDLLVFDEWRLTFPGNGKMPNADLEPFLRWHRHLVGPDGRSTDVVIGCQLIQDLHRGFRGLCHRSFKMKKLDAVAAKKSYTYHVFEGHLQPKDGHFSVGHGRYSPDIFALYSSYSGPVAGKEVRTDRRGTMFTRGFIGAGALALLMVMFGGWRAYSAFFGGSPALAASGVDSSAAPVGLASPVAPVARAAPSPFRIVGHIHGDYGSQIVVASEAGVLRIVSPEGFTFGPDGRPLRGFVDGLAVEVEERIKVEAAPMFQLPGVGQ